MPDTNKAVSINVAELDQHVASQLAPAAQEQGQKSEARSFAGLALPSAGQVVADVQAGQQSFCALCAEIRPGLDWFMTRFGWLSPAFAAKIKVFEATFFDKLYPKICGK